MFRDDSTINDVDGDGGDDDDGEICFVLYTL